MADDSALRPELAAAELVAALAAAGEPLVVGPGVLQRLDLALDEWLSFAEVYGLPQSSLEALVWPLAAFVGQSLAQLSGAAWLEAPDAGEEPAVRLPDGRVVDVFGSARRVLLGLAPPRFAAFEQL